MNERIKLLAEQAGYTKDMFGVGHWDMPECKKFVELIVKECIEAVRLVPYHSLDVDFDEEVIYQDAIRKHFGVEE